MKINEAIKEAMARNGMRVKDVAEACGMANNALSNQLSGNRNLSLEKVDNLLNAVGYKMMIVPNNVEAEDGWYEVTSNSMDGVDRHVVENSERKCPIAGTVPDVSASDEAVGEIRPLFAVSDEDWPKMEEIIRKVIVQEMAKERMNNTTPGQG